MRDGRPSRLVHVVGPGGSGDFAVTADSTFAELVPALAQALGPDLLAGGAERCRIVFAGRMVDPGETPSSAGVIDGDELELTTDADPLPPAPAAQAGPVIDDVRRRRFGTAAR